MYTEKKNFEAFDASLPIDASSLSFSIGSGFCGRTGLLTFNTKR